MKILHTSDWHLGHVLFGYDRMEEQKDMLEQIVKIVAGEQPDVFLLCGDVYHTGQPSSAVQAMFNKTIVRLHQECPNMAIVVTAGNHDSASKHEIFRIPWRAFNVYAIGAFDKENIENHIIEIEDKCIIIALPYTHEHNLRNGEINRLIERANEQNIHNLPIVLSAHTAVSGADYAGHENSTEINIGGIDTTGITDFGQGYDYFALGHIHKPQFIHTGKHNVRYSGSPLAVSFDEAFEHSITMVEIDKHGDTPQIDAIRIQNALPLISLPTGGFAAWEVVKQMFKDFDSNKKCYIRLNVELTENDLPATISNEAKVIAESKQCRFCCLNTFRHQNEMQHQTTELTIQEFQELTPLEIAKMYADDKSIAFDEDMELMFNEIIDVLAEENHK